MTQSGTPISDLNGRVAAALAADGLAASRIDSPASVIRSLDEAICTEEDRIGQTLETTDPEGSSELLTRFGSLRNLHALRREATELDFHRRLRAFSRVPAALNRLRAAESPEAVVRSAPAEAASACDLDRIVLYRIDGSYLLAESVFVRGDRAQADDLLRISRGQPPPLSERILETEIVRRRVAMLVHDAMNHPRTYKPLMALYETYSYVAAPIMPAGRVIGFLHGDRGISHPRDPAAVDDIDRDALWSFSVGLGYVLERAELAHRLEAHARRAHDLMVDAKSAAAACLEVDVELVAQPPSNGGSPPQTTSASEWASTPFGVQLAIAESAGELALTRRELEVLVLLAAGATNSQIADKLFITEGTAKSHVGRILRKLGAGNRVEAASMFLRAHPQTTNGH